jgi:hypothetical protein
MWRIRLECFEWRAHVKPRRYHDMCVRYQGNPIPESPRICAVHPTGTPFPLTCYISSLPEKLQRAPVQHIGPRQPVTCSQLALSICFGVWLCVPRAGACLALCRVAGTM